MTNVDWTLIVSGAITGVVGVGGVVAGARIASKSARENLLLSISAENYRQQRAEKREVYAACLAELTKMVQAAVHFATRWTTTNKDIREERMEDFHKAFNDMLVITSEADIIASTEVRNLLTENQRHFQKLLGDRPDRISTEIPTWIHEISQWVSEAWVLRNDLYDAMRADLENRIQT